MIVYPVILAGGFGKRLYPLSSIEHPKQFIQFFKKKTSCFQLNILRIRKIFKEEKIIITCNKLNLHLVLLQLEKIHETNYTIILEEESKNTFCSLLTVLKFLKQTKQNPDTIFISTSDCFIENINKYIKNIKDSLILSFIKKKHVIFGIKPNCANINYGYIKISNIEFNDNCNFFKVSNFIEKPNKQIAEKLIKQKTYLWNSGNFIFNYNTLLEEISIIQNKSFRIFNKMNLKNVYKNKKIYSTDKCFLKLENNQIDRAIIEKSHNLICCKSDFNWCDIGSFDTIEKLLISKKIKIPQTYNLLFSFDKNLLKNKSIL